MNTYVAVSTIIHMEVSLQARELRLLLRLCPN